MTEVAIRPFRFDDVAIDAAVARELAKVPANERGAIVAVAHADLKGARLVLAARRGDNWSFGGYLEKQYAGPLEAGAELRFHW